MVYRVSAGTIDVAESHSKWRIVCEPYKYKEYQVRYVLQEYRRFLFFWRRWVRVDWAFSQSIAEKVYQEILKSRLIAEKGKHVVWQSNGSGELRWAF